MPSQWILSHLKNRQRISGKFLEYFQRFILINEKQNINEGRKAL